MRQSKKSPELSDGRVLALEYGFPASVDVVSCLREAAGWYAAFSADKKSHPRSGQVRKQLQKISKLARRLSDELQAAPPSTRAKIASPPFIPRRRSPRGPVVRPDPAIAVPALTRELAAMAWRAERAAIGLEVDTGGAPANEATHLFIGQMYRLWRLAFPQDRGFARDAYSDSGYKGRFFEFCDSAMAICGVMPLQRVTIGRLLDGNEGFASRIEKALGLSGMAKCTVTSKKHR